MMGQFYYSFEKPEGRLFQDDEEVPDYYVDTPTKLGINRSDTPSQISAKCAAGIKKPVAKATPKEDVDVKNMTLHEEYEEKFGKKPHHLMKAATIKEALM